MSAGGDPRESAAHTTEHAAHLREHEDRLAAVVAGDASPDVLAECAQCRARWSELASVVAVLEADAAVERAVIADARAHSAVRGEDEALAALRARMGGAPQRTARRSPAFAILASLAAVLAVAWTAWMVARPKEHAPDVTLGGSALECLKPRERVDAYGEFRWSGALPPGGWYDIAVYAAEDAPGSLPRASATQLEDARWTPTNDEIAKLPASIRWIVQSRDATGAPAARCEASASLSR